MCLRSKITSAKTIFAVFQIGPLRQTEEIKVMGKKKRLWMKWGILLVMLGFVASQTESQEKNWDWKFFLENDECAFFYSPGTVLRSQEGTVRVWWKEHFKTKRVLKSRGFTGSEYDKVTYQINVTEINCSRQEYLRKFFMLCSGEGNNVFCDIHRQHSGKWAPVSEEQPIGAVYLILCR